MNVTVWTWVGFNLFILAMLLLDLAVFHRRAHTVRLREAATWSAVWVAISLIFAAGIAVIEGGPPALAFLTGYVIEKSLSVDNLFVFVTIFQYFAVPAQYQHRVLFWGIIGAAVMRGAFVAAGAYLLSRFHFVVYVFGALLIFTAVRMAARPPGPSREQTNRIVRAVRRVLPVSEMQEGGHFFTRVDGRLVATPLLLVLVLIEFTDILFAIDSIPAIFAVTREPFLVYSATMLAVLGLRAMYFLLAGVIERFEYLHYGLAFILLFVGVKMLLSEVWDVPVWLSLLIILAALAVSTLASIRRTARTDEPPPDASAGS